MGMPLRNGLTRPVFGTVKGGTLYPLLNRLEGEEHVFSA